MTKRGDSEKDKKVAFFFFFLYEGHRELSLLQESCSGLSCNLKKRKNLDSIF